MMDVAMYRPPKRDSEAWRIAMNFRYLLIRFKSGKVLFLNLHQGCVLTDNEIRKKLLQAEWEIIKDRFGEEMYKKYVKQRSGAGEIRVAF